MLKKSVRIGHILPMQITAAYFTDSMFPKNYRYLPIPINRNIPTENA